MRKKDFWPVPAGGLVRPGKTSQGERQRRREAMVVARRVGLILMTTERFQAIMNDA